MGDSDARVVVVTGGSKGIGRAVASAFAGENARMVLVHYDPDDAACNETLRVLSEKGIEAEAHKTDVSSFTDVSTLVDDIHSRFERIDVLINNAGITRDTFLMRMKEADWDAVLSVNLKSVFNCTQAVIRPMIRRKSGRIVNIASVVGQTGNPGQANYAASKAGIMGLTKTAAKEVAGRGITVNAVAPGFIDTGMTAALPDKVKQVFLSRIPIGRMGDPEEVADAVYWLCSPGAGYVTGQVIHVNGGLYM